MLRSDRCDTLDMFYAVDHQCDMRPILRCARYSSNILFVPGRIADQQVLEPLRSEIDSFQGGIAHNALKAIICRENAPQDADAPNRFGGQTYAFAMSAAGNFPDVLIKQVEIDKMSVNDAAKAWLQQNNFLGK